QRTNFLFLRAATSMRFSLRVIDIKRRGRSCYNALNTCIRLTASGANCWASQPSPAKNTSRPSSGQIVWDRHSRHHPCACMPCIRLYSPPAMAASTSSSAISTGADQTTQALATSTVATSAMMPRMASNGRPASPSATSSNDALSALALEDAAASPQEADAPPPPECPPLPVHGDAWLSPPPDAEP